MASESKIRVGIVGASASRGFASIAHIPALRSLPQFDIAAVCTSRQATAETAAAQYEARLAFSDPDSYRNVKIPAMIISLPRGTPRPASAIG